MTQQEKNTLKAVIDDLKEVIEDLYSNGADSTNNKQIAKYLEWYLMQLTQIKRG